MIRSVAVAVAAPAAISTRPVRIGFSSGTTELMAVTICSLMAGAIYTLALGEDVNWDWHN